MNDDLLVSYLLNEGDSSMRQRVEQWIIENADNQRYFEHFRIIWESSQQMLIPSHINEEEAWQRFRKKTFDLPRKQAIVKSIAQTSGAFRVAATVIICVGIVALSYFIWDKTDNSPVMVAALNEPKSNVLPDGSVVTLNKHSTINYHRKLRGDTRKITLKGEAFFKVTPNKEKPFVIDVNDVTVTVVGTSFNIKENNGNTEVLVESGTVKVEKNNRSILLRPGEKVVVSKNDSLMSPAKTKDKLYSYYITHEFVCDDTPLWKLVEVLNEAYGVQIEIANPEFRSLELTTTFHNEPLDNILSVISETFNMTIDRQKEKIILR